MHYRQGLLSLIYVYKTHQTVILLTVYCISTLLRSLSSPIFTPQMSLLTFHPRDLELLLRSKWFSPNCHDTITGIDGVSVMHLTVKLFGSGHLYRTRQSIQGCSPNPIRRKKLMFCLSEWNCLEWYPPLMIIQWFCSLTHKNLQRRKIIHGKDRIDLKMCISRIFSRCSCC